MSKDDSEVVVTDGRILLSVPTPGEDGIEDAALRVGDLRSTMTDFFEIIGGEGQGDCNLACRLCLFAICRDAVAGLKDFQQDYLVCRPRACLATQLSWMQVICKMELSC